MAELLEVIVELLVERPERPGFAVESPKPTAIGKQQVIERAVNGTEERFSVVIRLLRPRSPWPFP